MATPAGADGKTADAEERDRKAKAANANEDLEGTGKLDSAGVDPGDEKYHVTHKAPFERPMTWFGRAVVLTFLMIFPFFFFVMLFTGSGFGAHIFGFLHGMSTVYKVCYLTSLFIVFMLYLLDFSYWEGGMMVAKKVLLGIAALCAAVGAFFSAKDYPSVPVTVFFGMIAFYMMLIKKTIYRKVDIAHFLTSTWVALTASGLAGLGTWLMWLSWGHGWDDVKDDYREYMDCDNSWMDEPGTGWKWANSTMDEEWTREHPGQFVHNHTKVVLVDGFMIHEQYCMGAYLLWSAHAVASFACVIFGQICVMLGWSLEHRGGHRLDTTIKVFGTFIAACVLMMWVASSVAGANVKLSNYVTTVAFGYMIIVTGMITSVVGFKSLEMHILHIPIIQKIAASFMSDWVKAMMVGGGFPIMGFYLIASFINQRFRLLCPFGFKCHENDRHLMFTKVTSVQITHVLAWNWTSVLSKLAMLGFAFLSVNVGIGKLTNVFLSWLNTKLAVAPLWLSIIVFWFVGFSMFLCPVVPGVPVYLAGGVILTAAQMSKDIPFWTAVFATSVICFFIKLCAVIAQQKGIGEKMSNKVSIRQTCGVNSMSIKAIRMILSKKGINIPKVCILCGGPDWPTSVLTGILGLNWIEMQMGTAPVFFLIMPTCAAGAMLLKAGDPGPWAALAGVTLAVAGMVQFCAGMAAGYFIEQYAHDHHDELMALPIDQEVADADAISAEKAAQFNACTNWHTALPCAMKVVVIVESLLMMVAAYLVFFNAGSCFENFAVTDSIKVRLRGSLVNLVIMPNGWIVITFMFGSMILMKFFGWWAHGKVKAAIAAREGGVTTVNPIGGAEGAEVAEGAAVGENAGDKPEPPPPKSDFKHDVLEPVIMVILTLLLCIIIAFALLGSGGTPSEVADANNG